VDGPGEGRTDSGSLFPLLLVEGPPLGAEVEECGGDDEAAALANEFINASSRRAETASIF